ncbi:MAG: ATP-binding protein [Lachnospiraceae bacterium]|nr:ATP-binding protein [Lachnospiraceae bacterium]
MDIEKIQKIIEKKVETSEVDFKREFYNSLKSSDFPKDVSAFANLTTGTDKYIIFGIDDNSRDILGVTPSSIISQDCIDGYINETIEPFVNVAIDTFILNGKCLGYIKIFASNTNPPYVIKKTCGKDNGIRSGDIYIRKGACNQKASRQDIDSMYLNNGSLKIKPFENFIVIEPIHNSFKIPQTASYGHVDIEIENSSSSPHLLSNGFIEISSKTYTVRRPIYDVLPQINIGEHPIVIPAKSKNIYTALFSFSSQDCVDFEFNEDGLMEDSVLVRISLLDTDDATYSTEFFEAFLKAKGEILHKVKRLKSPQKTLTERILGL